MIRAMFVMAGLLAFKSAALAAEPATRPAAASVTFADGSVVEIVAIADDGQTPPRAWAPDGTELDAPPWPKRESRPPGGMGRPIRDGMRNLRLMARSKLADEKSNARVMVSPVMPNTARPRDPAGGAVVGEQRSGRMTPVAAANVGKTADGGQQIDVLAPIPADLTQITLKVTFAGGAWRDVERHEIGQPAPADAKMTIGEITEQDGRTSVPIRGLPMTMRMATGEFEVAAVLTSGKDARPVGMKVTNGAASYIFDAPANQIAAIVHRERPMELAEISGVALQPGLNTTPTVAAPTTKPANERP